MVLTKFKEIDICIQMTINAPWGTCSITMQGEAFATFTLCPFKRPSPTSLPYKCTQYLCARTKGCHEECLHIDLESFSLGKRINNITMQGGNRYFQLQIALKMFEK